MQLPASVVCIRALRVVNITGEHVVVHVNGAAVVDGIAQSLSHDGLAWVWRQTQLEETGLRGGQAVIRLWRTHTESHKNLYNCLSAYCIISSCIRRCYGEAPPIKSLEDSWKSADIYSHSFPELEKMSGTTSCLCTKYRALNTAFLPFNQSGPYSIQWRQYVTKYTGIILKLNTLPKFWWCLMPSI